MTKRQPTAYENLAYLHSQGRADEMRAYLLITDSNQA